MDREILDVVDERDNVIGKDTRKNIHGSGSFHRGIHVLLFNKEKSILLQKRSAKRDMYPNLYELSVSEHVMSEETYDETVRRGLSEELGIRPKNTKKIGKLRLKYGPNDNGIGFLFRVDYNGKIEMDRKEVGLVSFFKADEIKKMIQTGEDSKKFASWALEILRWYFGLKSKVFAIESYI